MYIYLKLLNKLSHLLPYVEENSKNILDNAPIF